MVCKTSLSTMFRGLPITNDFVYSILGKEDLNMKGNTSMIVKRFMLVLLLLAILFSFCGCGNMITHGEVYEKEHREAFTTVMMLPLTIYTGKTSTTTIIPYVVHYPERYVILIKDFDGENWVTEDFYVTKEVFDQIYIGDMFEYNKSRGDLINEPYKYTIYD